MKLPSTSIFARGFSLLETLLVIGLLGIVFSIGIVVQSNTYTHTSHIQMRDILISLLIREREASMANEGTVPHGVHIEPNSFTLFTSTYSTNNPSNTVIPRQGYITIHGDTLALFEQLSGESITPRTFVISDSTNSATVTINAHGRIDW